jgi:hypothetical protein
LAAPVVLPRYLVQINGAPPPKKRERKMNRLKILVLLLIAASSLLATAGSGTATATETALCRAPTTIMAELPRCEGEVHLYAKGQKVHAVSETFLLFETPFGNVECEEATIQFSTEQTTAIPLGAKVEALTFGKAGKCGAYTVTAIEPGTLDIEIIDLPAWTHNGTLTFTGTKIKAVNAFGIECIYSIGDAGTLTGGEPATIDFKGTATKVGGSAFCPAGNVNFIGFFKVTSPTPLWVST